MSHLQVEDLSILLVEPSLTQRNVITSRLREAGVSKLDAVETIGEALEKLHTYTPDLVISSLYFPTATGLDLLMAIRSNPEIDDMPFMLVSSEQKWEVLDPVRQAGVVAILPKPFGIEELQRALDSTLNYLESSELHLEHHDVTELRVLLVDDSRLARRHIGRVLKGLGIAQITEACDGEEAVSCLQEQEFDLVVTDFNMPKMDGEALTRYIRESSAQSWLPVLMVTSEDNSARLSSVQHAGVSALCDKPFEINQVRQLLHQVLNA